METETRPAPRRKSTSTRGQRNVEWIERHCRFPRGMQKGRPVRLTVEQREIICDIFDHGLAPPALDRELASYLALLQLCGIEAKRGVAPTIAADPEWMWQALGPTLERVLTRKAGVLYCKDLDTRYPADLEVA